MVNSYVGVARMNNTYACPGTQACLLLIVALQGRSTYYYCSTVRSTRCKAKCQRLATVYYNIDQQDRRPAQHSTSWNTSLNHSRLR